MIATLLAYCIAGHHSGLLDYGSEIDLADDGSLMARLKKPVENYQEYRKEIETARLSLQPYIPIKPIQSKMGFSLAFFTRMIFSILVDADFMETESFMKQEALPRGGYPGIETLWQTLDENLKKFDHPQNPINEKRTNTLHACLERAHEKPGVFSLTIPTGGGKTLTSMAFALKHAVLHKMKRVIYIIPYTSIIEQNAAVFREILGKTVVLEHHANFDWKELQNLALADGSDQDMAVEAAAKLKLAAENWDIPIVVTTNVQFFESLFANRSSRCRKLHNMAKSVLIFDEAQMLPREYLQPCLYAVHELVQNYGSSAIFCTATQPALEQFFPDNVKVTELCPQPKKLYEFFRRVEVKHLGKTSDERLTELLNVHPQVLCIVNTRKHAKGLFEGIAKEGRYHLSTLMYPKHRKEMIAAVRERIKHQQVCRVISTQIMEAGIDIDFPVGYRALAGLDSIIQAGGRVNREGKMKSAALYVFDPDSSFTRRTPVYIQQGAEVAEKILREFADPTSLDAIAQYYRNLYDIQDKRAFDQHGILDCFDKGIPGEVNFDFKTAAEKFNLITNPTVPVIIKREHVVNGMLQQLCAAENPWIYQRELQAYAVNIYAHELTALINAGAIEVYCEKYAVMTKPEFYDDETGLLIPESKGGEALFFDG